MPSYRSYKTNRNCGDVRNKSKVICLKYDETKTKEEDRLSIVYPPFIVNLTVNNDETHSKVLIG